jgi:N-acetylmuramoyl-L-alanine amidase
MTVLFVAISGSLVLAQQDPVNGSGGEGDADSVLLRELLREADAQLMWDAYREVGMIWKGGSTISFGLGESSAILDYGSRADIEPVRRENGALRVTQPTAERFRRHLGTTENGAEQLRVSAIFIDPGHGGRDSGAVGRFPSGLSVYEKDVVLDVGRRLREMLAERYPNREIVLSRKTDEYLSLEERTELANQIENGENETMVFISLHANASFNSKATGFEVWYLPPDYRRQNLVEPSEVGVEDPDVLSILNTIKEEEYTLGSIMLAQSILRNLEQRVGDRSPNRGIKEESWYVVRNAEMPSVLVEVGFVTNEGEARRLSDQDYLQSIARGIYTGIVSFIQSFEGS